MKNDLNFDDLSLVVLPVTIDGVEYTLTEASEDASNQYSNALSNCTRLTDGKVSRIVGPMAETQSLLVSLCLRVKDTGKLVSQKTLKEWPTRRVKKLFNAAAEISEIAGTDDTKESLQKTIDDAQEKIEKLEADELGNEPSDTTDG